MSTKTLMTAKLTTGAGSWITVYEKIFTVRAELSNTTTPSATVHVEYTMDGGDTVSEIATFTLSGALDYGLATFEMASGQIRLFVHAIAGTLAAVSGKVRH